MKAVKARTTAIALAGILALSACSGTTSAETAAVVDGRVITEQQVREATEQINTAFPREQQPFTASEILTLLIRAPYVIDAAAQSGRPQSESAARSLPEFEKLGEAPAESTVDVLRAELSAQNLDQSAAQALTQKFNSLDLTVSPRYGTFDAARAQLVADTPNWLVPAPAAPAQ
ncbi:hypothetical protein [Knoellia subterranea]|uniref:hypothetical protein n=1 Tax=Knoellia subterranea TaxID=184882 RepID=UPI00055FCA58|nr:hypothetical protein [Knoellia subterranea]